MSNVNMSLNLKTSGFMQSLKNAKNQMVDTFKKGFRFNLGPTSGKSETGEFSSGKNNFKKNISLGMDEIAQNFKLTMEGLSKNPSIGAAQVAFGSFGKSILGTVMKLGGAWGVAAVAVGALTVALTKFATAAESAKFRVQQSFKAGGRMAGVSSNEYTRDFGWVDRQALAGRIDKNEFLGAMGNARSQYHSLDKSTFDRMAKTSIDLGAMQGTSAGDAMMKLGGVLDSLSVSFEDAKNVGADFTLAELNRINALKAAGKQTEANAIILDKVAETSKNSAKQYGKTLSGQFNAFWVRTKDIFASLGKAIAPLVKLIMQLVNAIMILLAWLAKFIGWFFDTLAKIVDFGAWLFGMETRWSQDGFSLDDKKKQMQAQNYIDPRLKLTVNFEDATSMVSRIQKSIMEQNSPQVRQVHLLETINGKLDKITNSREIEIRNAAKQAEKMIYETHGIRVKVDEKLIAGLL